MVSLWRKSWKYKSKWGMIRGRKSLRRCSPEGKHEVRGASMVAEGLETIARVDLGWRFLPGMQCGSGRA